MRVALDCVVPNSSINKLEEAGHRVVVKAQHGESDNLWVAKAKLENAEIFVSQDMDIPKLVCPEARWMSFPQGMGGQEITEYILAKLACLPA